MRNFIGAETAALQAIQRAAENGFTAVAQININRQNMSAIPETLNVLDSLGTHMVHIIRTSESPRWLKSGENLTLGITEYFDVVLNIFKDYV